MILLNACSTSGNGTFNGAAGPFTADVGISWEPEKKGTKIGTFTAADTNITYDLYDVDGNGSPDFARSQDDEKWYRIKSYVFQSLGQGQTVDIQSQSQDQNNQSGGPGLKPKPKFLVSGGELTLSPSVLGKRAFFKNPTTGTVHVTLPFDPDMLSSSIRLGVGSDAAAGIFDFNGFTEDQILAQAGWVDDGDDEYTIGSYEDLRADGNTDSDDLHASFVIACGVEMPVFDDYDLTYSVVPGNDWDDEFECYGLTITGDVNAITAFVSDMGVTEFEIDHTASGLTLTTELDAATRTATSSVAGVPYDTYSY